MDKNEIEQRIVALRKQLEQIQANGNAVVGAIAENERWLKRLEQPTGANQNG